MKKISHWATASIIGVAAIGIVTAVKVVQFPNISSLLTASVTPISTPAAVTCDTQFTSFPTNGISVKAYGVKGDGKTDDTDALNAAIADITSKGQPVIIPAGTYMIDATKGVFPTSGSRIYLTSGATLKAIPNAVKNYGVVRIINATDVAIVGGVISGERNQHTGVGGEGGHGIIVGVTANNTTSHIIIKGVVMRDGWGDGLYINRNSSDISACYDTMIHNRRNNASIVGGDHITLSHDNFINATAEILGAGVDIEPNGSKTYIKGVSDVTVSDSISYGNAGDGLAIYGFFNPVNNITFRNNTVMNSGKMGIRANYAQNVVLAGNTVVNSNLTRGDYNYDIFVDHGDNYTIDSNKVTSKSIWLGLLVGNVTTAKITNNCLTAGKNIYTPPNIATITTSNNNVSCPFSIPAISYLDLTPPVIKLTGSTISLPIGSVFTDPGATATDAKEGPVAIKTIGTVDTSKLGTQVITYIAQDSVGNTRLISRAVKVVPLAPDTVAPVITLVGDNSATVAVGATFTDPGATATDERDGSVAVTKTTDLNTAKAGTYTITYSAADKAGNTVTATRTVQVTAAPVIPPTITLVGASTLTLSTGTLFKDPGATAKDAAGKVITVTTTGTVNTALVGTYTIKYTATDAVKNTATVTRTVKVVAAAVKDTTPPVVTLVGAATMSLKVGDTFTDPGANAVDTNEPMLGVSKTGTVNTAVAGTYTITYSATDRAGNTGKAIRTVTVTAPIAHTITLSLKFSSSTTVMATLSESVENAVTVHISGRKGSGGTGSNLVSYLKNFYTAEAVVTPGVCSLGTSYTALQSVTIAAGSTGSNEVGLPVGCDSSNIDLIISSFSPMVTAKGQITTSTSAQ